MASQDAGRLATRLWAILLALWALLLWRSQLSQPTQGMIAVAALALLIVLASMVRRQADAGTRGIPTPAGLLALAFVAYAFARWAAQGFPTAGAENLGTIAVSAGFGIATCDLLSALSATGTGGRPDTMRAARAAGWMLACFCALAFAFSVHAFAQRFWLYDAAYSALRETIAGREATPLEMGLLHHLKLKRVASVWGDPNALGAFLALSLAASWTCTRTLSRSNGASNAIRRLPGLLAAAAIPVAIAGIWFTGSRGALLDVLAVGLCLAALVRRDRKFRAPAAIAAGIALAFALAQHPSRTCAQELQTTGTGRSILSRSDTIRERVNYMEIGSRIVASNPVFGGGLGAVDLNYGRFKPVKARESKYLHNWVLQVAAELGLVGVGIAIAFLATLAVGLWRSPWLRDPGFRALAAMAAVFVLDALVQLSFNQREMMMTFGILAGACVFAAGKPPSPAGLARGHALTRLAALRFPAALCLAALLGTGVVPRLYALGQKQVAEDFLATGDAMGALPFVRRAQMAAPRDPGILSLLSIIEETAHGPASAIPIVEWALKLQPESAALHSRLGGLLLRSGRTEEAEREVAKAIELYPTHAEYHAQLSILLEARGDLAGALDSARRAAGFAFLYADRYRERIGSLETKIANPRGKAPQP
jgi:hypothetical protein